MKFIDERNKNLYLNGQFNPYQAKKYFLTGAERKLFQILQDSELSNSYYIFPQLHLSTLLEVKPEAKDLQGKFDWLNRLFVDFVIMDKETIKPVLVIELNDSTHRWNNRKARDQFVAKALNENKIPLLIVGVSDLKKSVSVIEKIKKSLSETFVNA